MENAFAFIKKHRFDIIITCSVIAFIYDVYFNKHTFTLTIIALYILGYAADSEKSGHNIAERKKLRLKGLTPGDVKNIAFVKDWEETRKNGPVKYALVYGGVFFGFALCGIFSIVWVLTREGMLAYISADPSNMFSFMAYTYVAGVIAGTILYKFIWRYKEQKFIRLTDPLH